MFILTGVIRLTPVSAKELAGRQLFMRCIFEAIFNPFQVEAHLIDILWAIDPSTCHVLMKAHVPYATCAACRRAKI